MAQDGSSWEGDLQDGKYKRNSNGNGQTNLYASKHDTKEGGVEDQPVQFIDLQAKFDKAVRMHEASFDGIHKFSIDSGTSTPPGWAQNTKCQSCLLFLDNYL